MSELKKHIDLITNSGCLTTEALKGYYTDKLSVLEKVQVKDHLDSCELCSDALEGFELMTDPDKINSIVSEINENLQSSYVKNIEILQIKKSKLQTRLLYFAAAASVLLLIGLYFFLPNYVNDESVSQSISQVVDLDKKSIPSMPLGKYRELNQQVQKQPKQNENIEQVSQKDTPNEIINKVEVKEKNIVNQPQQAKKQSEDINYVAPLKALRAPESIPELSADKETEQERTIESEDYVAVDIASTLPLEYYIGGVVVYDKTFEQVESSSYSSKSVAISGSSASSKKMNAIPQMAESASKKEKGRKQTEDMVAEEKSDYKNESELTDEDHFFSLGNEVPQFPGGYEALIEYLNSNLNYPKEARKQSLQGQVVVSFIIEENGEVSSAKIIHGVGGGCNEEAIRVIKLMPAWQPAYKEGNPVRVLFNMPITFKLN